ncbi:MAG: hypothetical protein Q9220_003690 [cf. Caloplaca sp. 1 TL-2023]
MDLSAGLPVASFLALCSLCLAALKHYTSKLATYDDISSLQTFGFRGEALSSLCALSQFHVVTARVDEVPKGTRLDFETSGKLISESVVASQKGTTVIVENLFNNLPVRRRELEKNIKREYGKVLAVLQAYACIRTSVKFSVSNVMAKGKKVIVFATKSNLTTRENIANVFGAKTLSALIEMDLRFELQRSGSTIVPINVEDSQVHVVGHVSKPVFGEGRQTPDRQLFFVNARPCTMPQLAKVFNEVYKSYNLSQSPFVFANIVIDTKDAYDVNVSPDKRTILLHEQTTLLESLRESLIGLFENQEQTVPQILNPQLKLPAYRKPIINRQASEQTDPKSNDSEQNEQTAPLPGGSGSRNADRDGVQSESFSQTPQSTGLISRFAGRDTRVRANKIDGVAKPTRRECAKPTRKLEESPGHPLPEQGNTSSLTVSEAEGEQEADAPNPVADFNELIAQQQAISRNENQVGEVSDRESNRDGEQDVPAVRTQSTRPAPGVLQNAFDRMRPRRELPQVATITIGSKTETTVLGPSSSRLAVGDSSPPLDSDPDARSETARDGLFGSSLKSFAAPGASLPGTRKNGTRAPTRPEAYNLVHQISPPLASDDSGHDPANEESSDENSPDVEQRAGSHESPEDTSQPDASDEEYLDDEGRKAKQDAQVADLIQQAEAKAALPTQDNLTRAGNLLNGQRLKGSTIQLLQTLQTSVIDIEERLHSFERNMRQMLEISKQSSRHRHHLEAHQDPEQKLSLTVSKDDFSRMNIIGQFNLGFILATRPSSFSPPSSAARNDDDELFIIDQHASDEKYNFERLQATTTVQNQRLVRPKPLDLTAIEEEIIIENPAALIENGFIVDVDESGDSPVGQRCRLVSLPMSREVTFDLSDLEELIALLGDSPPPSTDGGRIRNNNIPRPSKTRRLFAMRACRSSIMIGRTLQKRQMEKLVRHMGELDKPWNCPHGRPTMRHVVGLREWEGWREGDGVVGMRDGGGEGGEGEIDWGRWLGGRVDGGGEGWMVEEEAEDGGDGGEGSSGDVDGEDGPRDVRDRESDEEGVSDDEDEERRDSDNASDIAEGEDQDEEEERGISRQSISQRFLYN